MNINKLRDLVQEEGVVFLTYGGFLSQTLISAMTEALEKEAESRDLELGAASNIFTIFIELAQNMMNYSNKNTQSSSFSKGLLMVGRGRDNSYYVFSQNIIALEDKNILEPKLIEICKLDKESLKLRYRELRRESKKDKTSNSGGIGLYEIAKRCDLVTYEFEEIGDGNYYYNFKSFIEGKGK